MTDHMQIPAIPPLGPQHARRVSETARDSDRRRDQRPDQGDEDQAGSQPPTGGELVELDLALARVNTALARDGRPFRLVLAPPGDQAVLRVRSLAGGADVPLFEGRPVRRVPRGELEALLNHLERGQGILFESDA